MVDRLIRNCDALLYKGKYPEFVLKQDIAIEGSTIKEIGDTGTIKVSPETEIIEANGMLAIPGLINTHAHVPMVLMRNLAEDVSIASWFNDYIWPMESNLTAEDVYWGAMLGIAEMIENGVTCVADHYFYMDEVAKAVQESGMRANLVWAIFSHEGEEKIEDTAEFIDRWQGGADGRITTWFGPHSPYTCTPEYLELVAAKAKQKDVGIHIHVSETHSQVELALKDFKKTPVQVCYDAGVMDVPTIFAHCRFPQEVDFPLLAKSGTGIPQAPKTYMKHAETIAPVNQYFEHGVNVGMATDGAVSNNTMDILEQVGLLGMAAKFKMNDATFLPAEQLIDVAFRGSAKVIRQEDQIGELKAGMKADIALLKQDGVHMTPRTNMLSYLAYNARGSDVNTVLCDGKVIMRDRKLLNMDTDRIRTEVQNRVHRLSKINPNNRIAVYPA